MSRNSSSKKENLVSFISERIQKLSRHVLPSRATEASEELTIVAPQAQEKPKSVFDSMVESYVGLLKESVEGVFDESDARRSLAYLPPLNGYPSNFSVPQGEKIFLHIARNVASPKMKSNHAFQITSKSEKVQLKRRLLIDPVTNRVVSQVDFPAGVTCRNEYPKSFCGAGAKYTSRFSIDTSGLAAGIYEARFIDESDTESENIYFNVMPKSMSAESLVVVLPTSTWQAYNRTGGGSFYSAPLGERREVSMHRPIPHKYADSLAYVVQFLRMLQSMGIPYFCVSSENLHDGDIDLANYRSAAILTHDEYYTDAMMDQMEGFVVGGGRLVVAGGNTMYRKCHRVLQEEGVSGFFVNYGEYFAEPRRDSNTPDERPEESILGLSYALGGWPLRRAHSNPHIISEEEAKKIEPQHVSDADGYTVSDASHWIFRGLNLANGDVIGAESGVMDVEVDGVRLKADGSIDRETCFYVPEDTTVIGTVEIGSKHFGRERVGCLVETSVGEGSVLNFGTVGLVNGIVANDLNIVTMLHNAFNWVVQKDPVAGADHTAFGLENQADKDTYDDISIREDQTTIAKHYTNIYNDFFENELLKDKQIIDVGPGLEHYFVDILTKTGADVWTLDFNMDVVAKSRERNLHAIGADLRKFPLEVLSERFDGLFCRGSFNPFWFTDGEEVYKKALQFASIAKKDGWGWVAPYNAPGQFSAVSEAEKAEMIQAQIEAFKAQGYTYFELSEEQRVAYRVTRAISHPIFIKNLPEGVLSTS